MYEACIRVRENLPFPPTRLICTLLESALARVQRDEKITLCHYVWMGNHAHFIFVMRDGERCTNFLSEIQKQVTDIVKRLLGVKHLSLWEGEPSVMAILDLEKAKERISYLYCNPARAHLVESIEKYPGASSWKGFRETQSEVSAFYSREVPWIRSRSVPMLPTRVLTSNQDKFLTATLVQQARRHHCLRVYPNAYLKAFRVKESKDVAAVNESICADIEKHEAEYRLEKKRPAGAEKLRRTPVFAKHLPEKRTRRLFVLSNVAELRCDFIRFMKRLNGHCRDLYEAAKGGACVSWPPGIFPPRLPMRANALAV